MVMNDVAAPPAPSSPRERSVDPDRAEPPRQRPGRRLTSLDGLRGVASLIVVFHHLSLIAASYLQPLGDPPAFSFWWWEERTPLKLLTAGREAVLVFFVLSGLVVALPAFRRADFSWPGFMAGRFIRLYLPAWCALLLASLLVLVLPRPAGQVTAGSWMADSNRTVFDLGKLLNEATLFNPTNSYDNVLWTLRWEASFSLVLPLFIVLAMALRRWWLPVGFAVLGLAVLGSVIGSDPLSYLPIFFLGTLVAAKLPELQRWSSALPAVTGRLLWGSMLVVSPLVLVCSFLLLPVAPSGSLADHALAGFEVAGALGITVAAVGARSFRVALDTRPVQFLGRTSFSLYLVHVPLIVTIGYLIGDWNWPVLIPVGVAGALIEAALFYRFVEHPLHGLARRTNTAAVALIQTVSAGRWAR